MISSDAVLVIPNQILKAIKHMQSSINVRTIRTTTMKRLADKFGNFIPTLTDEASLCSSQG